jgi:hypothetical protein
MSQYRITPDTASMPRLYFWWWNDDGSPKTDGAAAAISTAAYVRKANGVWPASGTSVGSLTDGSEGDAYSVGKVIRHANASGLGNLYSIDPPTAAAATGSLAVRLLLSVSTGSVDVVPSMLEYQIASGATNPDVHVKTQDSAVTDEIAESASDRIEREGGPLTTLSDKFSGITSVAWWLRLLGRSDAANATAKAEFNLEGGTYSEGTDAQQALMENGANVTTIANKVVAKLRGAFPNSGLIGDSLDGATWTVYRGTDWTIPLTGLGDLTGVTDLVVTAKKDLDNADSQSLLQVQQTEGLLVFVGKTTYTPADATLTITDAESGEATLTIKAGVTKDTWIGEHKIDVKRFDGAGVELKLDPNESVLNVKRDAGRLVSVA